MAKKKKKKHDPDSIRSLTKKLDALFSKFVRWKDEENGLIKCFTCNHRARPKTMQAGHFIPRQIKATRWDLDNVRPQCYSCNMFYGGRPQDFRDGLLAEGIDVENLEARRFRPHVTDREALKSEIEGYSKKLKKMGVKI